MAFPTLGAQQETSRKILEDLQLKKQLLQKGVPGSIAGIATGLPGTTINQLPGIQISGSLTEFQQLNNLTTTTPRTQFNATIASSFGSFLPQESFYGNTYIPVLPRLDPNTK